MDLSAYYNDMTELPIQNIKDLVVHHAAIPLVNNPDIEDIHRIHRGNGWLCVGYHVFIKRDGTIQYGRPMDSEGAQAYGHNHEGLGVCLAGYFHAPTNDKPTEAQIKSLIAVLKNWKSKIPQKIRIIGHRDYGGTACPGDFLYSRLEEIRKGVETGSPSSGTAPVENPTIPADNYQSLIKKYSEKYNLSATFITAIIQQESSFKPDAVSSSGAMGLMQLLPGTFEDCRKKLNLPDKPFDPEVNIHAGCYYFDYIRRLHFPEIENPLYVCGNQLYYILAAGYNAGPNSEVCKYLVKLYKNKSFKSM